MSTNDKAQERQYKLRACGCYLTDDATEPHLCPAQPPAAAPSGDAIVHIKKALELVGCSTAGQHLTVALSLLTDPPPSGEQAEAELREGLDSPHFAERLFCETMIRITDGPRELNEVMTQYISARNAYVAQREQAARLAGFDIAETVASTDDSQGTQDYGDETPHLDICGACRGTGKAAQSTTTGAGVGEGRGRDQFTEAEQEKFNALIMAIGDTSAGNLENYQASVMELESWILNLLAAQPRADVDRDAAILLEHAGSFDESGFYDCSCMVSTDSTKEAWARHAAEQLRGKT